MFYIFCESDYRWVKSLLTQGVGPMKNAHTIALIAMILLVIGGLNWGLVGLFRFDLIAAIFGEMSALSRIIYVLVGLAAIYKIVLWLKEHR